MVVALEGVHDAAVQSQAHRHVVLAEPRCRARLAQTAPRTLGAVLDRAGDVEGMDCHLVRPRETSRASAESGKRDLRSPA